MSVKKPEARSNLWKKPKTSTEMAEKETLLAELLQWTETLALSPSYSLDKDLRKVFELLQESIPYSSKEFNFKDAITLVEFLHFSSIVSPSSDTLPTIHRITHSIDEIAQNERSYTSLVELCENIAKYIEAHYRLAHETKHYPKG